MSKESMELALQTAEGIANANWREWHELASPDEFERWVKSRANHMAIALREALAAQQEPVVFYRCNGCGHAYEQVHPTSCDCMEGSSFEQVNYYTSPPAQHHSKAWPPSHWTDYERSIAAAEREACAKVCEDMKGQCWAYDHDHIAAAIRARSNT